MRTSICVVIAAVAVAACTSCMPSSMILMAARSEYDIVNKYSTRSKIERKLGAPVAENAVSPIELSVFTFPEPRSRENYRERNFLHGSEGSAGLDPRESHVIVTHCRYVAMGKIVPYGYVGDSNAAGLMTLGVSEIVSIPMAISQVTPNSSIENVFDVWYSKDGRPLAYIWQWTPEAKKPNKSARANAHHPSLSAHHSPA